MHTEHLQNVRAGIVAAGWLIAIAVGSLAYLLLVAIGIAGGDDAAGTVSAVAAVAIGFGAGGFSAGFRAMHAPILHGIAIGLTSLVAWFLLNLAAVVTGQQPDWAAMTPAVAASLLLEQIVAAIAGAWIGYRAVLKDQPEPED